VYLVGLNLNSLDDQTILSQISLFCEIKRLMRSPYCLCVHLPYFFIFCAVRAISSDCRQFLPELLVYSSDFIKKNSILFAWWWWEVGLYDQPGGYEMEAEWIHDSPQLISSDPSVQSGSRSHFQVSEMQLPSVHWNSFSVQDLEQMSLVSVGAVSSPDYYYYY
jgi:hypothetical protein